MLLDEDYENLKDFKSSDYKSCVLKLIQKIIEVDFERPLLSCDERDTQTLSLLRNKLSGARRLEQIFITQISGEKEKTINVSRR